MLMARLVGCGDSSFHQLPCTCASSSWNRVDDEISDEDHAVTRRVGKISQISCGTSVAIALVGRESSSVIEWGTDMYGEKPSSAAKSCRQIELQQPLQHPVEVSLLPPGLGVRYIACGAHFVVAALKTGGCFSWGGGREPRVLGRGHCGNCISPTCTNTTELLPTPPHPEFGNADWVAHPLGAGGLKVVSLAAGEDHAVAVSADGNAWSWGRGDCGQLGCGAPQATGDMTSSYSSCTPIMIQLSTTHHTSSATYNRNTSAASGRMTSPLSARAVACGRDHSALLTGDGRLWTFGSGLYGQLGLGTVGERMWKPSVVDALEGVGTMRADGTFTGISSVACGAWHTAAVSTTGDVYTWGWARFGALGELPVNEAFPQHGLQQQGNGGRDEVRRPSAKRTTHEDAEVRPYPGLVDGVDSILSEDDEVESVGCGSRYTLVISRNKRAVVWGQIAPSADEISGGGLASHSSIGINRHIQQSTPRLPRELKPAELLRSTEDCCGGHRGEGSNTTEALCRRDDGSKDLNWRCLSAGCGPWYIVLGLEVDEKDAGS